MSKRIRIVVDAIEDRPERDVYRSEAQTYSAVLLDPQGRRITIRQQSAAPGQGVPMDIYHGLRLSGSISRDDYGLDASLYPLVGATRAYLRGDAGQALLRRICDGWSRAWDGSNMVGRLTDDAQQAWAQLQVELADYAEDAACVDAGDWMPNAGDLGLSGDETDDELHALADGITSDAWSESRVVVGGAYDRLIEIRADLNA